MELSPDKEGLTPEDLERLFNITAKAGDPEFITDFIMPTYHIRKAGITPISSHLLVIMFDADWRKLRELGEPDPQVSDPRRTIDLYTYFGTTSLRPDVLFKPREEIIEQAERYKEQETKELVDEALDTYQKLLEKISEEDVSFLMSLVGISIVDGQIKLGDIDPNKLEQVRKVVVLMDPVMRDIIRANVELVKAVEPDLAEGIKGTPMDKEENEVLIELRKRAEAIIGEWADTAF